MYLNYALTDGKPLLPASNVTQKNADATDAAAVGKDSDLGAYGAAELVGATVNSKADYFAQARLEKQTSRDHSVETLQSVIGGGDISNDEMVVNAIDAVSISKQIEHENVIESLILAKGFSDCVAYLDGETAKIVVESDGLAPAEAAAIKDIVLSEAEIPAEAI